MAKGIFTSRIIKIGNTIILQYRPGKYIQLQDGKSKNKISAVELAKMTLIQQFGQVDVGEIELAVAVSAVAIIFTTINIDISSAVSKSDVQASHLLVFIFHILAFIAFSGSSFSAGRLYYTFTLQKFPKIFLEIGFYIPLIVPYYLDLWKKMFTLSYTERKAGEISKFKGEISQVENEIGYLSLLGAFAVIWVLIFIMTTSSLVIEFYTLKSFF